MASASHSLGEPGTGTAQVRSAAARAIRAVPGSRAEPAHTRYAEFKQQIRQVLGWKKILNQQVPSLGGETAYSSQSYSNQSVLDQRLGSKQEKQPAEDHSQGSESRKPHVPSQSTVSDTSLQPASDHRTESEQRSQPGPNQSLVSGTNNQPAPDLTLVLEHSYRPVPVQEKATEHGNPAALVGNGESERTDPFRDQCIESQANNQLALNQRPVLGASSQPALEQSAGSVKQFRYFISVNAGSLEQVQPARSKLIQGVNLESEQSIQHTVSPNTEPEQQSPSVQAHDHNRSKQHNCLRDVKSVQHIPSFMGGNKKSQQHIQPFKCRLRPVLAHSTGLEHQILFTLTRNLGYISDLCNSVNLAQENQQPAPGDGSYISPGKRDSVRWPVLRKRAKSCPVSPERKTKRGHRVRFADSLGLELTVVRNFSVTEEAEVPSHVLSGLGSSDNPDNKVWIQSFKPSFSVPVEAPNFLERLRKQQVCLERVSESGLIISGTILVLNMGFEKDVTVRYTCTNWNLHSDVPALFDSSLGNNTDRFTFTLSPSVYMLEAGTYLEFAIRYSVNGVHFWDNNNNINYKMIYNVYQVSGAGSDSQSGSTSFV